MFLSASRLPKVGDPGEEHAHALFVPVPGYGLVGRGRYSAQQYQGPGAARTYALQPISSSVSNPSSGPRMHDYAIRAGAAAG